MKIQITSWMRAVGIVAVIGCGPAAAQDWAINADWAGSCSCNPACPCNFGSPATRGHCEGNGLIEIKEGHYGDVRLDGMSVVMAFRFFEWVKLYVDENATDEQAKAVVELIKLDPTFGIFFSGGAKILSIEKAPVSIEKTSTTVKFSVPDSTVEMEMLTGRDGKPVKIQNLSFPFLGDYTQYKSITVSHHSEDKEFSYSGTHGEASPIEATSKN